MLDDYSQMRSRSFRDARLAGEKMTHSHPNDRHRQATKMAMLQTHKMEGGGAAEDITSKL